MKKIVFTLLMLFVYSIVNSQPLPMNAAKFYAEQWLTSVGQKTIPDLDCVYTQSNEDKSQHYFYVFSSNANHTYIIVSADERILPVLGYSDESFFDPNNIPPNMKSWLDGYVAEMNYVFTLDDIEKHPDWQEIANGNKAKGITAVEPLLGTMIWDQNSPYNYYCPTAAGGPGGKCYAGCVATAMSMIMKFWNYPPHGFGQKSYSCPPYGTLSANFQNETYLWNQMPMQATSTNYDAIAKLMYHCGVSVEMGYGPSGSGASTPEVVNALKTYFGYQTAVNYKNKSSYTTTTWENMMKAELDLGRPMQYRGDDGSSGHSFVLDGYNNSNLFHFNWGWSGYQNGYFALSNLNPNPYTFNNAQGAVMNIEPRNDLFCNPATNLVVNYAPNCASAQLTWTAPTGKGETENRAIISDGAENHSNFAVNSPGTVGWTYYSNGSNTWGIEGVTFPNSGGDFAYIVFNPSATTPSMSGNTNIQPHTGQKFFACFSTLPQSSGGIQPNNHWIVSPQLNATGNITFSFWAKTFHSDYPERMKVRYSTTNNQQASFTQYLAGTASTYVTVPTTWTFYTYTVPATAKYVAIQCVSDDAFIFMVDDITIDTGGSSGSFTYNIYRDGTQIAPNITTTSYTDSGFTPTAGHTWSVKVNCNGGGESGPVSVSKPSCTSPPDCNPPTNLAVNYTTNCASAQLTWTAPTGKGETENRAIISDGAENHSNFAVNSPGTVGWIYYDNGSNTWGIEGISFPGSGSSFAYIVFNPSATTPSMSGNTNIQPHTGQKFFACFATLPPSSGGIQPNNHWIVSPQLNATGNITFSFWAKTFHSDYPERMKVRYSTTNNQQASFTQYLAGTASTYVTVPTTWTFYTYTVPATAKYVAIQCVSDDAFIFMVDDITIDTGGSSGSFTYNVYRDGTKIAPNVTTTSYTDASFSSSAGHTWAVETVCQSGTSPQTSVTKAACFVPVTNITGVPTTATATQSLTLTGTVVPSDATNKAISWSVQTQGGTGASISGSMLNTTNSGTCTVLATIANGLSPTQNYTKTFDIVVTKATLTGTPTISGSAVFDQTLTCSTTGLSSSPTIPNLGSFTYQWRRGTTNISGATSATYKLVQADIGQQINVQVMAANCAGTATSANTGAVAKAPQTAPAAPTLNSKTTTSITLNTVSGCEYNINGSAYQSSPVFSGLNPNTSYNFTQRKAETATHLPSPASTSASFSTDAGSAPQLVGTVTISGNAVFGQILTATPNVTSNPPGNVGELFYQWKRNGTPIGSNAATYLLAEADISHTMSVTVTAANCIGSVTSANSATVTKATQPAPAAPTLAVTTNTTIVLDLVSGCEYNINGGVYQTSNVFANLKPNTLYTFTQRKAETNTHFASPASAEAQFSTALNINENLYDDIKIYPNPTTGELTIDNGQLTMNSIEVFDVYGRKQNVEFHSYGLTVLRSYGLSHLSAGIYFVKIKTNQGEVVKKVVKE